MRLAMCTPHFFSSSKFNSALLASLGLLVAEKALAAEYYVSPTGSDSNAGTQAQPFATLQKGANTAAAGDTVWIRGGTYSITTPTISGGGITFTKSGTSDTNRIKFWAYPGETPVFDFTKMVLSTTGYTHGFQVTGSWLHFKGLEICYVLENTRSNNGVNVVTGGNNIFELLNMHHNQGNGIFVGKGTGGNLLLNCDAHDNYDPTSTQGDGQNADGFGVHYQTTGPSTIIRGCRSWWNSDDCYDFINQEVPVIVENSWAMACGYANSGTTVPAAANGNGFKIGSSATGIRHIVRNNVAWKNRAAGFYANHSSGGNTWYNNTAYNNGTQYNMLASPSGDPNTTITLTGALAHIMRNNIGFPNKNANMGGVDTAFNSWDLGIAPAASDFSSTTDTGAMGPRQADGSMPNLTFMKLIAGSRMIDKGTDVGLAFVGAAPDLGAYEYGAVSTSTGGATATGGASSTGGANAAGGTSSTGGTKSTGSAVATGGAPAVGGSKATGGTSSIAVATGGASTGGAKLTGGSVAVLPSGGALAVTGGAPATTSTSTSVSATGGRTSTVPAGGGAVAVIGGSAAVAGESGVGGASSTDTQGTLAGPPSVPNEGGCSCRVAESQSQHRSLALISILGLLGGFVLRRQKNKSA